MEALSLRAKWERGAETSEEEGWWTEPASSGDGRWMKGGWIEVGNASALALDYAFDRRWLSTKHVDSTTPDDDERTRVRSACTHRWLRINAWRREFAMDTKSREIARRVSIYSPIHKLRNELGDQWWGQIWKEHYGTMHRKDFWFHYSFLDLS